VALRAVPRELQLPVEMSLNEILEVIPTLSFADRQRLIRRAIEVEDADVELTPEENSILDQRLQGFPSEREAGVPAESLKSSVTQRLTPR
jgi:hypothetical protein